MARLPPLDADGVIASAIGMVKDRKTSSGHSRGWLDMDNTKLPVTNSRKPAFCRYARDDLANQSES